MNGNTDRKKMARNGFNYSISLTIDNTKKMWIKLFAQVQKYIGISFFSFWSFKCSSSKSDRIETRKKTTEILSKYDNPGTKMCVCVMSMKPGYNNEE